MAYLDLELFGFSASCMPSPTRLNASTVKTSARPGKSMYHQADWKIGAASASIWPHDAIDCTPTPRNDSDASSRMLAGMNSVV